MAIKRSVRGAFSIFVVALMGWVGMEEVRAQQVVVGSIPELLAQLNKSGVSVKMAPGEYAIGPADVRSGMLANPPLNFRGSNSTFDFTGVTLLIDTEIYKTFGTGWTYVIEVNGNKNRLTGLTMRNVGTSYGGAGTVKMGIYGDDNLIHGFSLYVQGSFPYGYGDYLGKGNPNLVAICKNNGIRICGQRTHIRSCKVITRAFGHGIFIQGAINTVIESTYVEGRLRPTNEMLAETSGPAFDLGFPSVWGGKIPRDEIKALSEDAIRAYPEGNGRATSGVRVLHCTVSNMRGGVVLEAAQGEKYATGVTVIGAEEKGYSLGSGGVLENSRGDARPRTNQRVVLNSQASNNTVSSVGAVTDNGTGNRVTRLPVGVVNFQGLAGLTRRTPASRWSGRSRLFLSGRDAKLRYLDARGRQGSSGTSTGERGMGL